MSDYAGQSSFWSNITDIADAAFVTHERLYQGGIRKLRDSAVWLRDDIIRRAARLASVTLGTKGTITGSVDLSGITYDATAGALNGLTLEIESDTSGAVTVTFGTGASAPTGPGDVTSQVNTQSASDPLATLGAGGNLSLSSVTTGGTGTINVIGGSAVTLLGFVVAQNATGVSAGGDGASLVGLAAIDGDSFDFGGGTLRAFAKTVADEVAKLSIDNVWSGINTFANAVFANISVGTGTHYGMSSRSVQRSAPPLFVTSVNGTRVAIGIVGDDDIGYQPFNPPHGATLTKATFTVDPNNATPPAGTSAVYAIVKRHLGTGVPTDIVSTSDNTAGAGYGAAHTFDTSAVAEVIDRTTYGYYFRVTGETGAGKDYVSWYGTRYTCTVAALDDMP